MQKKENKTKKTIWGLTPLLLNTLPAPRKTKCKKKKTRQRKPFGD